MYYYTTRLLISVYLLFNGTANGVGAAGCPVQILSSGNFLFEEELPPPPRLKSELEFPLGTVIFFDNCQALFFLNPGPGYHTSEKKLYLLINYLRNFIRA